MKIQNRICLAFLIILIIFGCDGTPSGPTSTEREVQLNGRKLKKHMLETDFPCIINLMFQVLDMDNKGIPGLTSYNFLIKEDEKTVSPTESGAYIMNRTAAKYVLKTVIMIDNSASIDTALQDLKNAAYQYIEQLTDYQQVAVFQFSDMPIMLQYFTNDIGLLNQAIDKIEKGYPSTNLYGSVIEGLKLWNDVYQIDEIQQGIMIVLTDGRDTQSSSTLDRLIEKRGEKMIYTIGVGNEINPSVLQKIGNAGYYHVDDYTDLSDKFIEIQQDVVDYANSFYWLVYFSPKRGNLTHELELHYVDNPYTKKESYVVGEFNSAGFYSVNPGIFIQSTMADPDGIDELMIEAGAIQLLEVSSFYVNNKPQYDWSAEDETVLSVNINFLDSSIVQVTATGSPGDTTLLTVEDTQNSLSKIIDIVVE